MALTDFFRINLPYGLKRNEHDEWFVFNREYVPLGWNSIQRQESIFKENVYGEMPIYTKYKGLTEKKILDIIKDTGSLKRDENGRIVRIFLYNDTTNPTNNPKYWNDYFEKIKKFSAFEKK